MKYFMPAFLKKRKKEKKEPNLKNIFISSIFPCLSNLNPNSITKERNQSQRKSL